MDRIVYLILAVAAAALAVSTTISPALPRDRFASAGPIQRDTPDAISFRHGEWSIRPLADYKIQGRLISSERYRFGRDASLSPIDYLLAWGDLSIPKNYGRLSISHGRFFTYRWGAEGPPLPPPEIVESIANNHLVPASDEILAKLADIEAGSIVTLHGKLIRATYDDGGSWVSSLTRGDTGNGACELFYVEGVSVDLPA